MPLGFARREFFFRTPMLRRCLRNRGRDHARRQGRASAAMRAHIELVRDEYEIYAVSV
jgi:hypothetical protein